MTLALGDVNGFRDGVDCVPTALCAISGKTPHEIAKVLQQAAAECGDTISGALRRDYNINHWLRAIKTLGGNYSVLHDWANLPHDQRPTIDAYLAGGTSGPLELVFFSDTHTGGKRVPIRKFPPEYDGFRVKYVWAVLNP